MYLRLPVCALLFLLCSFPAAAEEDRWYMISMGDSITAGFNTRWPGDFNNGRYNWSTGGSDKVESHYSHIKKIIAKEVKAVNVSKSRATSHELALQWRNIETPTIDYMTLLIGANDICDWHDDYAYDQAKFRGNVRYIIDKVIGVNSEVRIVLPSIPNMYHLYEQGKDKCSGRWDYFEICPNLLSSKRSDDERLAFRDRLLAANATLEELASHYQDNVKFVREVFEYKFSMQHVSRLDCFHPSILGQNELARLTWENGWYM